VSLRDRFEPVAHVHLLANAFYVRSNGFYSDLQLVPDFFVKEATGQQRQLLLLARLDILNLRGRGANRSKVLHDLAGNMAGHR
jgi:hypothetical protein